jgi:signal transduction histidine kinase
LSQLLLRAAVRGQTIPAGAVDEAAARHGFDRDELAFEVACCTFCDLALAELPPVAAIDAVLGLAQGLAPVTHLSLWRSAADGEPACLGHTGGGRWSRTTSEAARWALGRRAAASQRGLLEIVRLPDRDDTVLIARPRAGARACVRLFLRLAARSLASAVRRLAALEREQPALETLSASSERRLARIGFDLHDGPIQSLALLIADTRLLQTQLTHLLDGDERRDLVAGRVADLQAQLVGLEFELRSMCHSLEAPAVLQRPFERVIEHEKVAHQRLTGVVPEVELSGAFDTLTASQRIALLRVVQEALRNVREHSDAGHVTINIDAAPDVTRAEVRDDGAGFDVEAALARAVRDGRVGLIGMMERIRLLGGSCRVESRPGGPTVLSALLPRFACQAHTAA